MAKVEYRVRPVTRYNVTRYHEEGNGPFRAAGCESLGEFDSMESANIVAEALSKQEEGSELFKLLDPGVSHGVTYAGEPFSATINNASTEPGAGR